MTQLIFKLCVLLSCSYFGFCEKTRILGGYECSPEAFPFMVSVTSYRNDRFKHICGGTLINSQMVLTAAHCFSQSSSNHYIFLNGSAKTSKLDPIAVSTIYAHPSYKRDVMGYYNDIAIVVVQLAEKVILEPEAYIKLPTAELADSSALVKECEGNALVMGYGFTHIKRPSSQLYCVDLRVLDDETCQGIVEIVFRASHKLFKQTCAIGRDKSFCSGDSGGPLICKGVQYGIISLGSGCHATGTHLVGILTRADLFTEFIDLVLKNDSQLVPMWGESEADGSHGSREYRSGCESLYLFSFLLFMPLLISCV